MWEGWSYGVVSCKYKGFHWKNLWESEVDNEKTKGSAEWGGDGLIGLPGLGLSKQKSFVEIFQVACFFFHWLANWLSDASVSIFPVLCDLAFYIFISSVTWLIDAYVVRLQMIFGRLFYAKYCFLCSDVWYCSKVLINVCNSWW